MGGAPEGGSAMGTHHSPGGGRGQPGSGCRREVAGRRMRGMAEWADDRYPGKYLGRHEYVADASSIAHYIEATRDDHPWYTGASPWGGPVAPALLLHSEQYAFPLRDWYLPNLYGNLHVRQEW